MVQLKSYGISKLEHNFLYTVEYFSSCYLPVIISPILKTATSVRFFLLFHYFQFSCRRDLLKIDVSITSSNQYDVCSTKATNPQIFKYLFYYILKMICKGVWRLIPSSTFTSNSVSGLDVSDENSWKYTLPWESWDWAFTLLRNLRKF